MPSLPCRPSGKPLRDGKLSSIGPTEAAEMEAAAAALISSVHGALAPPPLPPGDLQVTETRNIKDVAADIGLVQNFSGADSSGRQAPFLFCVVLGVEPAAAAMV
jgi:hypothetical protein